MTVTVDGILIYQTEEMAQTSTLLTDIEEVTHGSFSLSDTKIGFTFGTNWSNGGELVILLGSVTTPIPGSVTAPIPSQLQEDLDTDDPYTAYTFETKSKSRGGTFVRLRPSADNPDTQPRVRVGNIRGTRTPAEYDDVDTERELTKRVVTVTPATSYPGEEHDYIVTFTAPGPMYNSSLTVTFPLSAFTFPEGRTASNQISVSAPGVSYSVEPITGGGELTVNLTRINNWPESYHYP